MQSLHQSFARIQADNPGTSKYGNAGQQAARQGETAKAIDLLRPLAVGGDVSSAASLAELYAFLGEWEEVITLLGCVLCDLGAIPDANGYRALLFQLLGRAGRETGHWKRISKIARDAIRAEQAREYGPYHEHVRTQFVFCLRNLEKYCRKHGEASRSLLGSQDPRELPDFPSEAKRRESYRKAVAGQPRPLKNNPAEFTRYQFTIARILNLDEVLLRTFRKLDRTIHFDDAVPVAAACMRLGKSAAAWTILRDRLHEAARGLPQQVAPIALLIDDALQPLMPPERCELVLSTPRGRQTII